MSPGPAEAFRRGLWSILYKKVHMETIQVVLDSKLLKAANRAARRKNMNRSALIRDALRDHLRRMHLQELEERDRRGYQVPASGEDDLSAWEREGQWPED